MRYELSVISKATGYTSLTHYKTLAQVKKENADYIVDNSFAVQIWDTSKKDYILLQRA